MTIDTKSATGRRKVRFDPYDALMDDARRLADGPTKMVGNWSLGQIFQHLAVAYNGSIDGLPFHVPWYIKVMARLFMRKKFLYGQMPSGFQIPEQNRAQFVAEVSTTTQAGLAALQAAVTRLRNESHRVPHPVFGEMTREEWDNWHWRHAELHLSFAVPENEPTANLA